MTVVGMIIDDLKARHSGLAEAVEKVKDQQRKLQAEQKRIRAKQQQQAAELAEGMEYVYDGNGSAEDTLAACRSEMELIKQTTGRVATMAADRASSLQQLVERLGERLCRLENLHERKVGLEAIQITLLDLKRTLDKVLEHQQQLVLEEGDDAEVA